MSLTVLQGATIFDGDQFLSGHSLLLEHGEIQRVIEDSAICDRTSVMQLGGGILAPGFVDLQVNGGGGVLFNNQPSDQALVTLANAHLSGGTTALLPTIISDEFSVMQAAAQAVISARQTMPGQILGLHVEGPYFSQVKRGAHSQSQVRIPTDAEIDWLVALAEVIPVLLTLAPEVASASQLSRLLQARITLFAGHTNATYEEVNLALEAGISGFTHLFNAMSGLESRHPNAVGAALDDSDSFCSIIADGYHVHPASIRLAYKLKAKGKLILVSDAMATAGSDVQSFTLYGETIHRHGGKLLNKEGKLAGSNLTLIEAVKFCHREVGIPLSDCLNMASCYPATLLGLQAERGKLQPGFRADVIHFNDRFEIQNCWVQGTRQWSREEL